MSKGCGAGLFCIDLRSGSGFAKAYLSLHNNFDHVVVRKSSSLVQEDTAAQQETDCILALEAVARLDNLTKLDIVEFDGGALPIRGLTVLFRDAMKLEALRLDSVRVSGTSEDYPEFLNELKGHPSLSEIHLVGCLPSRDNEMIQTMAEALAGLETLRVVEIVETRFSHYGPWTGQALAKLCRSPFLKALRVRGVRFLKDEHIILSAEALQQNNCMEELSLLCDIGEKPVEALCDMIVANRSLQILSLNRIMEGKQTSNIAKALEQNETIRELHLYFRYCVIEQLRSSFVALMEKNYTLEKLAGGWACYHLEMFLKLNRAGRRKLMGDAVIPSVDDWIDVMVSQQGDFRSLFYLLSQNPALCYRRE